jgi:hypothetical protein
MWKAIPTVAGAAISLLLHLQRMLQVITTIAIAIGCYLLLYMGEFLWHLLVSAPVAITDGQQKEISRLNSKMAELKKHRYDEAFEQMVREKVQQASEPAQQLLRFMLDHGEMDINHVKIDNGNHFTVGNECYSLGFFDKREHRPGNGLVAVATYYRLKDNFHPVLRDIFYPRSS